MTGTRVVTYAGLCVLLIGAAGYLFCKRAAQPTKGDFTYVAMGSSYAAGPGVGERAPGSFWPCWRSDSNYARLFARAQGLSLNDVTCSGATTSNLLYGGQLLQPAQVDAVGSKTELVTITIGGNDVFYTGNLTALSCEHQPEAVPPVLRLFGACRSKTAAQVDAGFNGLGERLHSIVIAIHERAPRARVVFVDYATALPATGTCSRLGVSVEEADVLRATANRLRAKTEKVAAETGSALVRSSALTAAHNVCANDPWVSGLDFPRKLGAFGPVPFHPTQQAMVQVAQNLSLAWQQTPAADPKFAQN